MKFQLKKMDLSGKVKWIKTKKKKTKVLIACTMVFVLAAGGLYGLKSKRNNEQEATARTLSAQVQKGSLSTTIEGTGTLANGDSDDVEIPVGIEVKKVKVSLGDEVKKGDTLATVDPVSVSAKLLSTQEELEEVNGQINDEADLSTTQYVTSPVDGRVKKIYAKKNVDVGTTIIEKGALMLVSLDGKMAVDLETSVSTKVGQEVTVTLSDGDTVTGTVVKSDDDSCTVTVTDNGTDFQEKVTVTTSSGKTVGSGKLYINKEAKITAASGTVKSILVSKNEKISEGEELLKLKGDFQSSVYLELQEEKENLEEKLKVLLQIAQNNTITANADGIITAVNVSDSTQSSEEESSGTDSTGSTQTSGMTKTSAGSTMGGTTTGGGFITTVSTSSSPVEEKTTEEAKTTETTQSEATTETAGTTEATGTTETAGTTEKTEETNQISSLGQSGIAAPKTGEKPVTVLSGDGFSGTVTWNPKDAVFQAETVYSAKVTLQAKAGYMFAKNFTVNLPEAVISDCKVTGEEEGNSVTFTATYTKTQKAQETQEQENKTGNEVPGAQTAQSGKASGSAASGSGVSSVSASSTGNTSSTGSDTGSDTNTELTTAFSIASGETMTLSVNVDEMDILSVSLGQKVEIELDAIENEQFEGEITSIDKNGTSNGGVTKYPVEISVTRTESMLSGMNASATIIVSEAEDVLLIPSQAVTEEGSTSYVYISQNEKTGELTGKTEVSTGASNGSQIEITQGLTEGDTVYYQVISESENSQNNEKGFMPGSGMGGQGMERPNRENKNFSGGNMPSQGGAPGGGGQ